MAFKAASCNPSCATPLFDDLVKTNNIDNIFSISLRNEGGTLILGGIDHSLYSGDIHYEPLRHGYVVHSVCCVILTQVCFLEQILCCMMW